MQVALVERARAGDEEAFASLARGAGDRLLAIAFRILRDLGHGRGCRPADPRARLAGAAGASGRRTLRRLAPSTPRQRLLPGGSTWPPLGGQRSVLPFDDPSPSDDYVSVVERDQLERGFRRLPPEQRAVFVFHHHLGLTLLEIADQLGIPLGTVKSRLHYATNTLRAALEADLRSPTDASREHSA